MPDGVLHTTLETQSRRKSRKACTCECSAEQRFRKETGVLRNLQIGDRWLYIDIELLEGSLVTLLPEADILY